MSRQSKKRNKYWARKATGAFKNIKGPSKTTPKHGKRNRQPLGMKTAKEISPLAVILKRANERWKMYVNAALS